MTDLEHKVKSKSTGTTTVAIRARDAVVLAADQKATEGYLVAGKAVKKIFKVSDRIAVTIACSVGDAGVLVRFLQATAKTHLLEYGEEMDTEQLATFLSTVLNNSRFYPYFVQLILGGYVKQPKLVDMDMVGGTTEPQDFTSSGSGSVFAYGVLEDNYHHDISRDEAVYLAVRAVRAARERDIASGGAGITVVVISKDGFQELREEEVNSYLEKFKAERAKKSK
ncbi:MAG TPA: proteasome subunit beta [archaeon]|nr:proteasome subunit beta [archaeon]